jgi:hypothetical protein
MRLQMLWWTSLNWLRLAGAVATAVPVANRMATLKDHDADPVPGRKPFTISGADELNASDLTLGAWRPVGVLAFGAWAITGAFSGRSFATITALPLIMGFWIYALVVMDRWVRKRQRTSSTPM